MATIEERKQQLEKKLKKMAEDNVVVKPVTVPNPFDPSEDTEPSPATLREEDESPEETKPTNEKPADEWIKKMWYIYTMEYYAAI